MEKVPNWLRWILVLPAAVVAFWAIQLVVIVGGLLSEDRFPNWVYQLINSAASGYAFVAAAAWMAPRGKLVTAIINTVIVTTFGLFTFLLAAGASARQSDDWLLLAVAGVLTIGGGAVACYIIWEEEHKRRSIPALGQLPS